jgi:transposase
MKQLGMPVSDDTILRHLKRMASQVDNEPPARIIGIDDWSWRKSWRYGTIIVDLERRQVMDILEDRSVTNVVQWLKRHPSIEVVSRDRCGLTRRLPVKVPRKRLRWRTASISSRICVLLSTNR